MAMDYRRLDVWKKSMMLVKMVYPLIERLPQEEKYALGNQIRRAVTSIVRKRKIKGCIEKARKL